MPISKLLFSFQGRMRRSQWWGVRVAVTVIAVVIYGAAAGLSAAFGGAAPDASHMRDEGAGLVGGLVTLIVGLPLLIAYLWIFIATSVKRLHDQDLSGWFTLIYFIPYLGGLVAFVMLGCLDGTKGPNKFGPSEKYPTTVAQVFA